MTPEQRQEKFRQLWQESGLTLKQIGELVQTSEPTVKHWSCGIRNIPPAKLELLEIKLKQQ